MRWGAGFATTHWSVVLNAGQTDSPAADQAMARLCSGYWYPLYAYVRRQGYHAEEAKDLTQEFFAQLLAKNYLRSVDPHRGKFRSFLLAAMEHFLAKEWRDSRRLKRGGGQPLLSLDEADAEGRYKIEPLDTLNAERLYERRWALTLLEQSLQRLRQEFAADSKAEWFEVLSPFLSGERMGQTYAQAGARLGLTEEAVKKAVQCLRKRYGETLRQEIAQTVVEPAEVDSELRYLLKVVSS